ncbi:radical SAM protein [Mariniblastus fucicola]|uniref:Pyrroloquinoline quinone biosynthesis protein PqqE n=1 Tax=Mariniblastus fucicola TaxID=980251 RepID=A0A5B9PD53_9BACT|nr:radical SAM protein [Mariniblastus fucicola]QEG23115.1 pyrroloquinoline quinone biosynthesis protein PqqE [Mariniblastus fucicola]
METDFVRAIMHDSKTTSRIELPLFTTEQKRDVEKLNREILEIELNENRYEFASRPHEAHIQFSNFCNMSCVMCWNGNNPKTQKLTEELVAKVADQLGPHLSLIQPYDGSEPLILTWEETRDLARKYGVQLKITTNVQFLDEEKFNELKDITQTLCLSIDTHVPEIFEKIRLRSNSGKVFKNFAETAQRCREANLECTVNVVLMMENLPFMPDTLRYFAEMGYDDVNLMQMIDINSDSNFHDPLAHFSDEFLEWVKQDCIAACKESKIRMLWNVGQMEIFDYRENPTPLDPRRKEENHFDWRMRLHFPGFCRNVMNKIRIEADGNVAPCCYATQGQLSLGNLNQQNFEEIWNGTEAKDLRRAMYCRDLPSLCTECRINEPMAPRDNLPFVAKVMQEQPEFFAGSCESDLKIISPEHVARMAEAPIFRFESPSRTPEILVAVARGGEADCVDTFRTRASFDENGIGSFAIPAELFARLKTNHGQWIAVWQAGENGTALHRCEKLQCFISHQSMQRLDGSTLGYTDEGYQPLYELGAAKPVGFAKAS